jgi:hypothetical protein
MFATLDWSADDDIPVPDGSSAAELRAFYAAWRSKLAGQARTADSPLTGLPMARDPLQPLNDRRSSTRKKLSDLDFYIGAGDGNRTRMTSLGS